MGDNRDHSHDSRFWGTVPTRYVKGRAFLVYWSYGGETSDGSWHGWGHRLRQLGNTAARLRHQEPLGPHLPPGALESATGVGARRPADRPAQTAVVPDLAPVALP